MPGPRRRVVPRSRRPIGRVAESLRAQILPSLVRHLYPAYRFEAAPVGTGHCAIRPAIRPESRSATLQTARGRILLRDLCPRSLIERLHADPGLAAFTHMVRNAAVRMRLRCGSASTATVLSRSLIRTVERSSVKSYSRRPRIGGEILPGVYELSIETSRDWRRLGIARGLLDFCMQPAWIEHIILLAMGLDWHWDLKRAGLDAATYRAMLQCLFEPYGFRTMRTAEPNVGAHASNLLLVRFGKQVAADRLAALDRSDQRLALAAPATRHMI